eukprot:3881279-Alexandrium_andersonii.AAC.1
MRLWNCCDVLSSRTVASEVWADHAAGKAPVRTATMLKVWSAGRGGPPRPHTKLHFIGRAHVRPRIAPWLKSRRGPISTSRKLLSKQADIAKASVSRP